MSDATDTQGVPPARFDPEQIGTHYDDCWKGHPGCAYIRAIHDVVDHLRDASQGRHGHQPDSMRFVAGLIERRFIDE